MNQENNNVQDNLLDAFENPNMIQGSVNPVESAPVKPPAPESPSFSVPTPAAQNIAHEAPTPAVETSASFSAPKNVETPVADIAPAAPVTPVANVDVKKDESDTDDPKHFKKTIIFVVILFALIILFIFFLPQIMGFFGSSIGK